MPRRAVIDMEVAERLYSQGKSWDEIGAICGCTAETVRRRIDPVYAAKKREQRENFLAGRSKPLSPGDGRSGLRVGTNPVPVTMLPPDTRTWQQRFMGDPEPGRFPWNRSKASV